MSDRRDRFCSDSAGRKLRGFSSGTELSLLLIVPIVVAVCGGAARPQAESSGDPSDSVPDAAASATAQAEEEGDFSATDVAAAQQFGQTLGITEWLGPLAPMALSPFFGIACLSGMAIFGKGWVSSDNAFLGENSPLNNPAVFWVFLGLTVLTSLPRLTKVSKPFAQAVDRLESWAGILTILVMKFLMSGEAPADIEIPQVAVAGIGTLTMDVLLSAAAVLNVLVISSVRFFFEVLIWITPIPAIDAVFEACNKAACAGLMAVYGYSPTIATAINLLILAVCLIVFRWIGRRERFFRTMMLDAVLSLWGSSGKATEPLRLVVFPVQAVEDIPARARCFFSATADGWVLECPGLLRKPVRVVFARKDYAGSCRSGVFSNEVFLEGTGAVRLTFGRREARSLRRTIDLLKLAGDSDSAAEEESSSSVRTEFA